MGANGTTPMIASAGAKIWSFWEERAEKQHISWATFQKDFRAANPNLASDGQLKEHDTYNVPVYTPVKDPAPPASAEPGVGSPGAGSANAQHHVPTSGTPGGPLATGPAPGTTILSGQADGSSSASPIRVAPGQVLDSVSVDQLIDGVGADAFVVAVKGSIGVQNIPGWDKIPGLKNLGKDAQIGYLGATLTPFGVGLKKDGSVSMNANPLDTTLFLSLTIPGVKKQVIITTKLSQLNFEGGVPIENKPIKGGKAILFSNFRGGVYANAPGDPEGRLVTSVNGGILVRSDDLKKTAKGVTDLVHKLTRTAQAAQAISAAAAAPETAGGSLVAGAESIAVTEIVKHGLMNSLDKADWYVGLAWRGEGNVGVDGNGAVTIEAQKGALKGKWITFNLQDVPGSIFDSKTPDFADPDKDWLISQGAAPETADLISKGWHVDGKGSLQPLIKQMAGSLNVSPSDVVGWLNTLGADKHTRGKLGHLISSMASMPQHSDGSYSVGPSDRAVFGAVPPTVADLITVLDARASRSDLPPLPRGS